MRGVMNVEMAAEEMRDVETASKEETREETGMTTRMRTALLVPTDTATNEEAEMTVNRRWLNMKTRTAEDPDLTLGDLARISRTMLLRTRSRWMKSLSTSMTRGKPLPMMLSMITSLTKMRRTTMTSQMKHLNPMSMITKMRSKIEQIEFHAQF